MQFLLSHWHCILPVVAILIGLIFMNRDSEKENPQKHDIDFDE
ncbi:hypothetical protein [Aminipila sp.]|nr:hypothetical protein [Aminipila sp.]